MTESERQLEALIDLERAHGLERELRLESEALLSGLNVLSKTDNPKQMFRELIEVLRSVFKFEEAFILVQTDKNYMKVVATTHERFEQYQWRPDKLFQRVITGEPIAVFDVQYAKEWNSLPDELLANVKAALHVPLSSQDQTAILVCIHSQSHFFGPKQVKVARRFAPLISQAFINIDLKRTVTERERLFTMSLDMMGITNFNGVFRQFNSAWEKTLGYSSEQLTETRVIKFVIPEDRKKLLTIFRDLNMGITNDDFELRCYTKSRKIKWLLCSVGICKIDNLCYVVARDITTLKITQQKLAYEADHDTLTGLANRKLIIKKISHAITQSSDNKKRKFTILFLDLDRFKLVNDSLGHLIGDKLLKEISIRIKQAIPTNSTLARLGGDEFLILLDDVEDFSAAIDVANLIKKSLKSPIRLNGFNIVCATSIGITSNYLDYKNPADMLRDADIAMYFAKRQGGASYAVFDSKMHIKAIKDLKLETDLHCALAKNELQVLYQPINNIENNNVEGFEALLRWQYKDQGLLGATQFIPIAEESELISFIGLWTIEKVCHDIVELKKNITLPDNFYISINLSAKQLWQKNLLENVKAIVDAHELPPSCLKFEITESMVMNNALDAVSLLESIKNYGIGLFVDDFGTGYSSLSYLHRFPFDVLKIDKSFTSRMEVDQSSLDIVRTIIIMAKSLNLKVVAEGIETQKQLDLLSEMNCNYGQGYLYSKAVHIDKVIPLLQSNKQQLKNNKRADLEINDCLSTTTTSSHDTSLTQ